MKFLFPFRTERATQRFIFQESKPSGSSGDYVVGSGFPKEKNDKGKSSHVSLSVGVGQNSEKNYRDVEDNNGEPTTTALNNLRVGIQAKAQKKKWTVSGNSFFEKEYVNTLPSTDTTLKVGRSILKNQDQNLEASTGIRLQTDEFILGNNNPDSRVNMGAEIAYNKKNIPNRTSYTFALGAEIPLTKEQTMTQGEAFVHNFATIEEFLDMNQMYVVDVIVRYANGTEEVFSQDFELEDNRRINSGTFKTRGALSARAQIDIKDLSLWARSRYEKFTGKITDRKRSDSFLFFPPDVVSVNYIDSNGNSISVTPEEKEITFHSVNANLGANLKLPKGWSVGAELSVDVNKGSEGQPIIDKIGGGIQVTKSLNLGKHKKKKR